MCILSYIENGQAILMVGPLQCYGRRNETYVTLYPKQCELCCYNPLCIFTSNCITRVVLSHINSELRVISLYMLAWTLVKTISVYMCVVVLIMHAWPMGSLSNIGVVVLNIRDCQ